MYVENWISTPYEVLQKFEKPTGFYSDNNEQMRSKSEVIIANQLKKYKIPYKYECPLSIGGRMIYPDFTVLNVKKRKELYWEHLGLLDDSDYLEKIITKFIRYELNGFFPGDKLIITFETSRQPLNVKLVEYTIQKYCK